jgi:hypothetical protein
MRLKYDAKYVRRVRDIICEIYFLEAYLVSGILKERRCTNLNFTRVRELKITISCRKVIFYLYTLKVAIF